MRLGIYGGTFNPIHLGHLIMAIESVEQIALENILFLPSPIPPHKQNETILSYEKRCKLIRAAISREMNLQLSLIEDERPGPHYAVDTIKILKERYPQDDIVFLMGGDSLRNLHTWYQAEDFVRGCDQIGVFRRPGGLVDLDQIIEDFPVLAGKVRVVEGRLLDISSSEIRERIRTDRHYRYFLPNQVFEIIHQEGYYRSSGK